jgi:hypothetical protein
VSDTRTRREKLRDMAHQTESPQEAEVARRKLGKGFLAGQKPRRRPVVFDVVWEGDDDPAEAWERALGKVED